jgi:hypothetical protein
MEKTSPISPGGPAERRFRRQVILREEKAWHLVAQVDLPAGRGGKGEKP